MQNTQDLEPPVKGATRANRLVQCGLLLALACAFALLLAGPAYRMGWLPLEVALKIVVAAALIAWLAAALQSLALLQLWGKRLPEWQLLALLGLCLAAAVALPPLMLYARMKSLPYLHDISTDTENPPDLLAVPAQPTFTRKVTRYPLESSRLQQQGYPDIAPLVLPVPADQAFAHAVAVAQSMDWDIVSIAPQERTIEATATSLLFGFKDDVVIRVTPQGNASRVDMRSVSRVGTSDFGVNAGRIRSYLHKLRLHYP